MPLSDPAWRVERARIARRCALDPEFRRERKAAAAERYIRALADLTLAQRAKLAADLLRGAP